MRMITTYNVNTRTTTFVVELPDSDWEQCPLDMFDKYILESPIEYPIADALQNLQLIAFRLEQAKVNDKI